MKTTRKKPTAAKLFVCDQIVRNYNVTAAFVFAHIAYHIVKHGSYDASPRAAQTTTGVSRMSVKRWIQVFVKDKLLIKREGRNEFRSALTFNTESDLIEQDLSIPQIIEAYSAVFSNQKKESTNPVQITAIELEEIDLSHMVNKKAEHQRSLHYLKAYLRDRIASANVNSNSTRNKVNARYYTTLARSFGFAVNTIRKLVQALVKSNLLTVEFIQGNLILGARLALGQSALKKSKLFTASKSNKGNKGVAKQGASQGPPGDPLDIPFLRYT